MRGDSVADTEYLLGSLSTDEVSPSDRAEYWTAHVRNNHGNVGFNFADTTGFFGLTHVQRCGPHQLIEFSSREITYQRTKRQVSNDDDCSARLLIPLQGKMGIRQEEQSDQVGSRQAGLLSWGREMHLGHADNARALILTIPEGLIPLQIIETSPLTLDLSSAALGTVVEMTKQLARYRETMPAWEFVQISSHVLSLLAAALDHRQAPEQTRLAMIGKDARAYIEQRSDDPSITVKEIAEHLGCSRRQLERALKLEMTTPAQLLRDTRVEKARLRLEDSQNTSPVDRIGIASGFNTPSVFQEAFRSRYGFTPREWRKLKSNR